MSNTSVHDFQLKIIDVFKVEREEEAQRYEPFRNSQNCQLLWHGSRVTNFASIVQNGLKITSEVNGSMFGRGIYFADMVSKSANYCKNDRDVGLLALCEVALGNVYELIDATSIASPPNGFDSVKGIGKTQPNMQEAFVHQNGSVIPLGKPVHYSSNEFYCINNVFHGSFDSWFGAPARNPKLFYNEFIVYNEDQINLKYLVMFQRV
jgi:poly [ADP-ribose] polymerase